MERIDIEKLVKETGNCTKKLAINEITARLTLVLSDLPRRTNFKQMFSNKLSNEEVSMLWSIILTDFSLELLARVNGKKDFEQILKRITEKQESEA